MNDYRVSRQFTRALLPLAQAIVVATAVLLSTTVFAAYVDLKVTSTGANTKLEIEASEVKCGSDKNCIKTTKGQSLDLDFRLKNACKSDGPAYKLNAMQFSQIQSQPDPDNPGSVEKTWGKYLLPPIVTSDFDTDAKGNVKWDNTSRNNNKLHDDKIKIKDKNQGKYVVYFRIGAVPCGTGGGASIWLDPRFENTGN
jgi:hypothetical protein